MSRYNILQAGIYIWLEAENRPLKQLVADLTLDNTVLREITAKNGNACPRP